MIAVFKLIAEQRNGYDDVRPWALFRTRSAGHSRANSQGHSGDIGSTIKGVSSARPNLPRRPRHLDSPVGLSLDNLVYRVSNPTTAGVDDYTMRTLICQ
jgi:hypothetical protein